MSSLLFPPFPGPIIRGSSLPTDTAANIDKSLQNIEHQKYKYTGGEGDGGLIYRAAGFRILEASIKIPRGNDGIELYTKIFPLPCVLHKERLFYNTVSVQEASLNKIQRHLSQSLQFRHD